MSKSKEKETPKEVGTKKLNINETKERIITAIPVPDNKTFDKIMEFVVEYHKLHGRTASIIPTTAMIVTKGQWIMRRAVELDDEHLIVQLPKNPDLPDKNVLRYFTHVPPSLGAIEKGLFLKNLRNKPKQGYWYLKSHLIIGHEPITRDFYTGRIADEPKKLQKLEEVGSLIKADSDLAKATWGQDCSSPTGYFIHPDKVELDQFGKPRQVYDISDIDAITSEVAIAEEKKLVDNAIEAAFEAYEKDPNKQLMLVLLGGALLFFSITFTYMWFFSDTIKTLMGV